MAYKEGDWFFNEIRVNVAYPDTEYSEDIIKLPGAGFTEFCEMITRLSEVLAITVRYIPKKNKKKHQFTKVQFYIKEKREKFKNDFNSWVCVIEIPYDSIDAFKKILSGFAHFLIWVD